MTEVAFWQLTGINYRRGQRIVIPQLIVMIFTNSQLLVESHLDPLLAAKEETKRNK